MPCTNIRKGTASTPYSIMSTDNPFRLINLPKRCIIYIYIYLLKVNLRVNMTRLRLSAERRNRQIIETRSCPTMKYIGNVVTQTILKMFTISFCHVLHTLMPERNTLFIYWGFTPLSTIFQLYHLFMIPGKQTSTRLENVSCPRALHHDRSAATGDRIRDTRFRNPRR